MSAKERIVGVAFRSMILQSVVSMPAPKRHHDIIRHMIDNLNFSRDYVARCQQGFLTDRGRFVSRRWGALIADRAGQTKDKIWPADLFSEDVW